MGVKSYTGGHFSNGSIRQILQQERYTGNTLFQKTYIDTFGSGKTKYNNGELPQYYVRNTHPAIISEETFNSVQEIRQKKRELGAFANPHIKTTALTSKIKCKHCNRSFQRTSRKLVNGRSRYWVCATRKAGQGNPCGTGDLHEEQLKKLISEVLEVDEFDDELFLERVDHIEVTGKDLLEFFMTDGSLITRTYVSTARKDAWTPEVRKKVSRQRRSKDARRIKNAASPYTGFIRCGRCGNSFYGQKLTLKDGTKVRYLRYRTKLSECPSNTIQESTLNALVCDVLGLDDYDEAAMDKAMDYFRRTATLDLDDTHGNTRDGIHTANMGGVYLGIVAGVGGLRIKEDGLHLSPRLPEKWDGYSFTVKHMGATINIQVRKNRCTLELLNGEPVTVFISGKKVKVKDKTKVDL